MQILQLAARRVFGSRNDRVVKQLGKLVKQSNALEEQIAALDDAALQAKTQEFKEKLQQGTKLDDLQVEAFAVVREAAKRVYGMRHYDVQLIGGLVLHQGKIAEMRTGEGKTLVATLAAYLNALTGEGVHVITVNDYLARRDGELMGQLYDFLGLSVGVINSSGGMGVDNASYLFDKDYRGDNGGFLRLAPATRQAVYAADITYGTNNEFGFDYLRDNMAFSPQERVQRALAYAIIDEVDSILIDEARTPLIISGPTNDNSELYSIINAIAPKLVRSTSKPVEGQEPDGDFVVDEKHRSIALTEQGHEKIEQQMADAGLLAAGGSLYDASNIVLMHHVDAALRAHHVFLKNVHYVVDGDEVIIVDESTGRKMPGRRWSDGLHQAVEAKEGVTIQNENQTVASITFQNYFRLYKKLSGMTGTADTEAMELMQIYKLEVIVIPTHKPMVRDDRPDLVFMSMQEKYTAIIKDIQDCMAREQPVLIGTASIEASEILHELLQKAGIKHEVLNAKQHEREAHIVAEAGKPGAVTIATNMAGRGTDIVLGGSLDAELDQLQDADEASKERAKTAWCERHEKVLAVGGLHIIGSERHESRRIDNQLRGRAGRQGDAGSSRFYLSMEDNLMRIFISDKIKGLMQKIGMQEGEAIEHPWLNRAIENAQKKVEGHNYDQRKNILEYDNVANDQRRIIYQERSALMEGEQIDRTVAALREQVVADTMAAYIRPGSLDETWDIEGLEAALLKQFAIRLPVGTWLKDDQNMYEETIRERIIDEMRQDYEQKMQVLGEEDIHRFEKQVMLWVLDSNWKDHLANMDYLRQGIGMRSYAQKDPKREYQREAFAMFSDMLYNIKAETISKLHSLQIQTQQQVDELEQQNQRSDAVSYQQSDSEQSIDGAPTAKKSAAKLGARVPKVGRNSPCPCGSGKKYKHCCGKLA